MRENLTELICILDRSGSMNSILNDAIGGFNSFLDEQRKLPGEVNITVVLFNDDPETIHNNVNLNEVENMTRSTYVARGGTALYDAIGMTLTSVGERLANTDEADRPSKIIVAILTDGEENSSRTYAALRIKQMIQHQEMVYNWTFMFLAANQDACLVGRDLGMQDYATLNFAPTAKGTSGAFKNMSMLASTCRGMSMDAYSKSKTDILYSANYVDAEGNNN
jgi:uncharacterized protein YegL